MLVEAEALIASEVVRTMVEEMMMAMSTGTMKVGMEVMMVGEMRVLARCLAEAS